MSNTALTVNRMLASPSGCGSHFSFNPVVSLVPRSTTGYWL
jgi:hypothetical protein